MGYVTTLYRKCTDNCTIIKIVLLLFDGNRRFLPGYLDNFCYFAGKRYDISAIGWISLDFCYPVAYQQNSNYLKPHLGKIHQTIYQITCCKSTRSEQYPKSI